MKKTLTLLLLSITLISRAQDLKPGFDKEEYREMMMISIRSVKGPNYEKDFPKPQHFRMLYQSADIGLDNSWDLWTNDKGTAVVSLRGTTQKTVSWLENFYAAMVPAKGSLQLKKGDPPFEYQLAENPAAAVHVGWLYGMAVQAVEIVPRIDSLYKSGTKNVIVVGHSQGGGIAFLLTAYLYQLQKLGKLPADIRFKTYCSAGPKPGNLQFAYEYEALTQNGWAYNVINAVDWVPETPFSVQTLDDFNRINPFVHAKTIMGKQKFPVNIALKHVYRKMDKPTKKAQKSFEKYLGNMAAKMVKKVVPDLEMPAYAKSNNYVRTGNSIVLRPDEDYFKAFPQDPKEVFINHLHKPYLFLLDKLEPSFHQQTAALPQGKWELTYITGLRIAFEGLYPQQKPNISFQNMNVNGHTSCNPFSTVFTISGTNIKIEAPKAMTMRFCEGQGESQFLSILQKADSFQLNGNFLSLYKGDVELLKFKKTD